MADTYQVLKEVIGSRTRLDMTASEFQELAKALDGLTRIIDIEEAYEILIQNYVDYEKAVAGILIEEEVRQRISPGDFDLDRRRMSRMTANLLSSAYTFREIIAVTLPKLLGKRVLKEVRAEHDKIAEASFPYRFMETLRNHSQHEHFAVNGLTYGASWLEISDNVKATRVHTFKPSIKPQLLKRFKRFESLIAEFETMREADATLKEGIDLTRYVRLYVETLGDLLNNVRTCVDEQRSTKRWNATVDQWLADFAAAEDSTIKMGVVAQHRRDGELVEERHLGSELGDILKRMQRQNRKLVNLHRIEFRT